MLSTLVLSAALCAALGQKAPIVQLGGLGKVQGHYGQSLGGRQFYAFEGVPFAQPPTGELRFQDPRAPSPWPGVWQAKTIYRCIQNFEFAAEGQNPVLGDEDCLYLNIYTPTLDQGANLDVIVFIHGGAFMFFSFDNGPRHLLDKNVVYINLNYRLGPLGFLSTASETVPGNAGLKDQILALEFIREHVKSFGGNPSSVTLMGTSAGGASVQIHYLSPRSQGLFARGFAQSGTALNPWVLMEKPLEKAKLLARDLGCATKSEAAMVACLRRRPARQLVERVKSFQPWLYLPFSPFGAVVDAWSKNPVLPQHPYKLLSAGKIQDLPFLASETDFEGVYPGADLLQKPEYLGHLDRNWNALLPLILDYYYTVEARFRNEVSQRIRQKFLKGQNITREVFPALAGIFSSRLFLNDIHKSVQLQASRVNSSVFFYYFTHRGADSWHQKLIGRNDDFGAGHGEDVAYFLSSNVNVTSNEEDKAMVAFFVDMITNFARTGNPKTGWAPVSKNPKDPLLALRIHSASNTTLVNIELPNQQFWEDLPIMENEKIVNYGVQKCENAVKTVFEQFWGLKLFWQPREICATAT